MLRALDMNPGCRVLKIGTGSGYSTALLAELVGSAGRVVSMDVDPPVSEQARSLLSGKGYTNVQVTTGDGRRGWPSCAPYDRVVAWCSVTVVPRAWIDQSAPEAILVVPMLIAAETPGDVTVFVPSDSSDSQLVELWLHDKSPHT